jgi:hypothetical protein
MQKNGGQEEINSGLVAAAERKIAPPGKDILVQGGGKNFGKLLCLVASKYKHNQ